MPLPSTERFEFFDLLISRSVRETTEAEA